MSKMILMVMSFVISLMFCGCSSSLGESLEGGPGLYIYSNGGGKIQCRSQMDKNGRIVVLLESLQENTTFEFLDLINDQQNYYVHAIFTAELDPEGLARRSFIQPVYFEVNPVQVDEITLSGETVYKSDFIEIRLIKQKLSAPVNPTSEVLENKTE